MKEDLEPFPDILSVDPDGLIAVGGDLSAERLLLAYSEGIFPWFSKGEPILWWSPDPRMVLYPQELIVSRSMKQLISKGPFTFSMDTAFREVMHNCSTITRKDQDGTWITDDMIEAYVRLYDQGIAHSIEVWRDSELVGGLYGVALGKAFFGESMFHKETNASKAGFIKFVQWGIQNGIALIDCQVPTEHLKSLGAREIKRSDFLKKMKDLISKLDIEVWKIS